MIDVCAVGHITLDRIQIGGGVKEIPGGAAYYLSLALRRLGRKIAVVTKMARANESLLLSDLRGENIDVLCIESSTTTVFENLYPEEDPDLRVQSVSSLAAPFAPSDLGDIRAQFFHLGPLTNCDMPLDFLQTVSAKGEVSLDIQGLVRGIQGSEVVPEAWEDMEAGLACIAVLKADEDEARMLVGEGEPENAARRIAELGPREVIVTSGSRGSLIFSEGRCHRIPPVRTSEIVDTTGCGDTYIGAYLHRRLAGDDVARAGRFAAAAATLSLKQFGPFQGSEQDVENALAGMG